MSLKDTLKAKAEHARARAGAKAGDFVEQHGEAIGSRLDKVAHTVDEKTKHKYSGKIHKGVDKTKDAMEHLKDGGSKDTP
ncbi:antitoxin [Actinacidiphila glaucinigra]|uniref:antitoxin n=1 Tax=Actinacidiphila glaucinigra TaxID=235986 RepID=UPI002DD958D8|nr:antitoxin [Actinacidiphila glaucinigra]WSD59732.1 antitoxin [Actinacidiphila glaucinigra]